MDFNRIDIRKFMIYSILICSSIFVEAQNNLVFNRVLNFGVPSSGVTVPDGKAWKIEAGSTGWFAVTTTNAPYGDNLNSEDFDQQFQAAEWPKPIWLAEGTLLKHNGGQAAFVSILEFNVVPISSTGSGTVDTGISNGAIPGDDYTPGDSFSDIDGNTYETVEINGQTWTTTNLNVSTYRDGTPIPYISDLDEWNSATYGAYTYAAQDSEAGYGKLYNLYAVLGDHDGDSSTSNKILAPEGYHIPTPSEWSTLIEFYTDGVPFPFNTNLSIDGPYQADIASVFLRSQTTWNINGNNESGLNIKNYPIVYGSTNFYNIGDLDIGTAFATQTVCYYNPTYRIGTFSVFVQDFALTVGALWDNISQAGGLQYTTGNYVRLIKDY